MTLWEKEKCWFIAFSPFPVMFPKGLFLWVIKSRDFVVELNILLFTTQSSFNDLEDGLTFYSIDTYFSSSTTELLKTLWEKKKLFITSIFFFSHNVFYSIRKLYPHLSEFLTYLYLLLISKSLKLACEVEGYENNEGKGESGGNLNPFPNKPWFSSVCSTSHLKTLWEKEKLLVTSNFSFSHSVFYPLGELSTIFIKLKIVVCKLFLI